MTSLQRDAPLGPADGRPASPRLLPRTGWSRRSRRRSGWGGGGWRHGCCGKAWGREVEGRPSADQACANVAPREVGHALGDQGDQVTSRLSRIEQLIKRGLHLAVDEEAAPELLDAVVAQVVLAQQRQQLERRRNILSDANGPEQLLLDRL
jgi:hypothetical protein